MRDFERNNETCCSKESCYLYNKVILGMWQSCYSKDLAIAELAIVTFYCMCYGVLWGTRTFALSGVWLD